MKQVLIIKNWDHPDILRQTPGGHGIWKDIKFTPYQLRGTGYTLDSSSSCDYVIVFNHSPKNVRIHTFPENIWSIQQEPPNEFFKPFHKVSKIYKRVFITDPDLKGERYIHSQPTLPWHIDKDYDFLKKSPIPNKPYRLSWVTSNKKKFQGQKSRMQFLEKIKSNIDFNLYGRGFKFLEDKWEGLAPYRYSLAIENYQGPYYFSEKLTDCFLSWTMPIYFGCTNITDYFPKDSLIQIDIKDPGVVGKIKKIIKSDLWLRRRKAIEKARILVLEKYQFFPFMVEQIKRWERRNKERKLYKEWITIPNEESMQIYILLTLKRMPYYIKKYITGLFVR